VSRAQVLAFRAAAHSLDRRRPVEDLLDVAGACGIQDTPPGNADVSLAARLQGGGPLVKGAVAAKELLVTWSVRGAPHVIPRDDFAVFTIGARPADGTRGKLWGEPEEALAEVEAAVVSVLESGSRTKGEVSAAVTATLPAELTPWCASCKAHHPRESVFRATPLLGRIVLISTAPVVMAAAKEWVGADAGGDAGAARAELLRRYLHCYGPTTSGHFAEWAGITKPDAAERWAGISDGLVAVGRRYVLEEDMETLLDPPAPAGVRLLPAKDGFLQARDRDVLIPDPTHRKAAFPVIGGPGVVLHEATPVATWRGGSKGKSYEVTVTPFGKLSKAGWDGVDAEADRVARVRGRQDARVVRSPVP